MNRTARDPIVTFQKVLQGLQLRIATLEAEVEALKTKRKPGRRPKDIAA